MPLPAVLGAKGSSALWHCGAAPVVLVRPSLPHSDYLGLQHPGTSAPALSDPWVPPPFLFSIPSSMIQVILERTQNARKLPNLSLISTVLCLKPPKPPLPRKHLHLQNLHSAEDGPGSATEPGLRQEPRCCCPQLPETPGTSHVAHWPSIRVTLHIAAVSCERRPHWQREAQLSTDPPFLDTGSLGAGATSIALWDPHCLSRG